MKTRDLYLATAVLLCVSAGAAFGESLWVKAATVDLRSGKGAVYPSVATMKKGQEVTVISRDGGWVQVSAANFTGWVFEGSLSKDKVGADFNLMPGATAEMGTGAAARGLQPGAEDYVKSHGVSKVPLEHLMTVRANIKPAEWAAFSKLSDNPTR
jgi:hypothetical protein